MVPVIKGAAELHESCTAGTTSHARVVLRRGARIGGVGAEFATKSIARPRERAPRSILTSIAIKIEKATGDGGEGPSPYTLFRRA